MNRGRHQRVLLGPPGRPTVWRSAAWTKGPRTASLRPQSFCLRFMYGVMPYVSHELGGSTALSGLSCRCVFLHWCQVLGSLSAATFRRISTRKSWGLNLLSPWPWALGAVLLANFEPLSSYIDEIVGFPLAAVPQLRCSQRVWSVLPQPRLW